MANSEVISKDGSFALPPTDEQQAAWEALSREEQLHQLREHFASKDANTVSGLSVEEIVAETRARLRAEADGAL